MNQIISMDALERQELAQFERKAKENLLRREAMEQMQTEARAKEEQEIRAMMQRAEARREEREAAAIGGAVVGMGLAVVCAALEALWVLPVALGWVLGVAWKGLRR